MILKKSYIVRLPGNKYRVYSEKGKNMGTYNTKEDARKRLQQIEYFKHQKSDDGQADDKESKMLGELSNIAKYLEDAGYVDKAKEVYNVMCAIDPGLEQDIVDHNLIPDAQRNVENKSYIGGDGTGGGYSMFNIQEGQPADDNEQKNIDMAARSNGLQGITQINNQGSSMTPIGGDSYFYGSSYDQLEPPYR